MTIDDSDNCSLEPSPKMNLEENSPKKTQDLFISFYDI